MAGWLAGWLTLVGVKIFQQCQKFVGEECKSFLIRGECVIIIYDTMLIDNNDS